MTSKQFRLIISLSSLLVSSILFAQKSELKKIKKELTAIAVKNNFPTLSATITRPTDSLKVNYRNDLVQEQTLYGLGSTTKFLAALLIMKYVEDGKLDLDEPITKYITFPDAMTGVENKTIRHLLNHTAGFADYTQNQKWMQQVMANETASTFEAQFALVDAPPTNSGTFKYSNTHYLLLQKVASHIAGTTFKDAFNTFYKDLGFNHISIPTEEPVLQAFFAQTDKSSGDVTAWKEHYGFAAGAYATSSNLAQLLHKLYNDKSILKPETLKLMENYVSMEPMNIPLGAGMANNYGLGVMKVIFNNQEYIGHMGGTLKYQSFLFYNKANGVSISIITNCSGKHYNNAFFQEMIPTILQRL